MLIRYDKNYHSKEGDPDMQKIEWPLFSLAWEHEEALSPVSRTLSSIGEDRRQCLQDKSSR